MDRKTRRIVEEVFGDEAMNTNRPEDNALHAYVEAQVRGDNVATLFPDVHAYLASIKQQDDHYQALLHVLRQEQAAHLETPPVPARFSFSYLQKAVPSVPNYFVELGRLVIKLSRQFVEQATSAPRLQPSYLKSNAEPVVFETVIHDQTRSFKTKLIVKHNKSDRSVYGLSVSIETAKRHWPHLGGIPVEITMGTQQLAQVTNAFGSSLFPAIPIDALDSLMIVVGPTPELADQP